ncbi:hypothetical protein E6R60_06035 [Streptomyces sp. A0642]|uniref:hypothetical protein n=1 Tax=unclassified Streptomyces TaxID=2593676 RepID=UPI0010A1FA51|nr:hypothetical protein [Streptomyces sp. A0642]THA78437.1 hypothetical protein E6R60_06035 [Streptomyces sp. A0642]
MISEPEMAGAFDTPAPREVLDHSGPQPEEDRPPRAPRPGARWLWALGGAVVTSAVWGAVLFADGPRDGTPDLHGYRLGKDPCAAVRLKSIGAAIAPRETEGRMDMGVLRHAALDRAVCFIPLWSASAQQGLEDEGWSVGYEVTVRIALHKKTDPRAEFEAERNATEFGVDPEAEVEAVPELGDKAYLLSSEGREQELRVLEGGAVLSLSISASTNWQGDEGQVPDNAGTQPDLAPHKAAMISDMRDLMSDLKS